VRRGVLQIRGPYYVGKVSPGSAVQREERRTASGTTDRTHVSFAGLTKQSNLGMSAGAFGFATGMFYRAYFIFEVPGNVDRLPSTAVVAPAE
jgi:hypothetical protein